VLPSQATVTVGCHASVPLARRELCARYDMVRHRSSLSAVRTTKRCFVRHRNKGNGALLIFATRTDAELRNSRLRRLGIVFNEIVR